MVTPPQPTQAKSRLAGLLVTLLLLGAGLFAWFNRFAAYDWWRLRGYTPSSQVSQLATVDTMTSYARHMFYVNRPAIEDKSSFNQNCPNDGGEQTIVLGCYRGNEMGIYLYSINDPKLNGVEQVTAAHETLHAIYERLSPKDKQKVNAMLEDYYKHDLKDKRILDTIASYKKTEPNDVVNEMHSVFGTEVANLPPALEAYYKQYFTKRQQIVKYAQQYQQTFVDNQSQADQYLSQIKSMEQQLTSLKSQIDSQEGQLQVQAQQLDSQRQAVNAQNVGDFNAQVHQYNAAVQAYKNLINRYNSLIDQHNAIVAKYQTVTVENNQLIRELDSRSATVSTQ